MKRAILFIAMFSALAITAGATIISPRYSNTIAAISTDINNAMTSNNIVGASVALVDGDEIVWAQGFGYADRERAVPATEQTVYHIGSISKVFCTLAIMQLQERGLLHLDAPVTDYFPGFSMLPRFTNNTPITIRSLLCHISGIPGDMFNGGFTTVPWDGLESWCTNKVQNDYPTYPPNYLIMYDNSAFCYLDFLIEKLTGTNCIDYGRSYIFTPMGMTNTSYIKDLPYYDSALSRNYMGGLLFPDEFVNAYGVGSIYSTAIDMTKLIKLVLNNGSVDSNQIVSSESCAAMLTPQGTNTTIKLYSENAFQAGLGWDSLADQELNYAGRLCHKNGGTAFFLSLVEVLRDQKLGIIILQNSAPTPMEDIARKALRLAVLEKTSVHWPTNDFAFPASPVTNLPATELQTFAGIYATASGYDKILATNGALTWIREAGQAQPRILSNLTPHVDGYFYSAADPIRQITFTNIDGRTLLAARMVSCSTGVSVIVADKYSPQPLSAAWLARTKDLWAIEDMHPNDICWYIPEFSLGLSLSVSDDVLLATTYFVKMIGPVSDNLAFAQGLHNREASTLAVSSAGGLERIDYGSHHFIQVSSVPAISSGESVSGDLEPGIAKWYRFAPTGGSYQIELESSPGAFLNLVDEKLSNVGRSTNGLFTVSCESNALYYVAICSPNAGGYSLKITE